MAAPERILGFLPTSSAAMASCPTILSIRSLHSKHEFGHHHPNQAPHGAAPTVGTGSTAQPEGSRTHVSSLLKAVQQGGANTVIQQVSSMKHLLILPELPYALIDEIMKKMALSFIKEQDDEVGDGLMEDSDPPLVIRPEGLEEKQGMGPRCAWPRSKAMLSEEVLKQQEPLIQGPRCAWPRGVVLGSSNKLSQQAEGTVVEGGAKCSWPRAKVGGCVHTGTPSLAFNNKGLLQEENEVEVVPSQQGPRCAWPRGTVAKHAPLHNKDLPRRMLATSVGLSLMNYLLVAQGAPSLACPVDLLLLQDPMGHELLQSPNKRSLIALH